MKTLYSTLFSKYKYNLISVPIGIIVLTLALISLLLLRQLEVKTHSETLLIIRESKIYQLQQLRTGLKNKLVVNNILQSIRIGDTGETYIVSKDGELLSESRFTSIKPSAETMLGMEVIGLAERYKSGTAIVEDYRGVKVLSAYAIISVGSEDVYILSEQDLSEALGNYNVSMILFSFIVTLSLVTMTILSYFASSNVAQVEENIAVARGIMDSTLQPIFRIDAHGTIIDANTYAHEVFEPLDGTQLLGQNINIIMAEPYRTEHDTYMNNFARTGIKKIIGKPNRLVQGVTNTGEIMNLYLSVNELVLNGVKTFIGVITDLNELIESNERLQSKADILQTVVYSLSHDIRGGLDDTVFARDMLEDLVPEAVINEYQLSDVFHLLDQGTKKQTIIIDGLRSWLKSTQEITLDEANIEEIVNKLVINSSYMGEIKIISPLPSLLINKDTMSIVFDNLFRNAFNYNESSNPLVEVYDTGNAIAVSDNGIGIDEKLFEKLIQPFQRGNNVASGTGLGMSIINNIINAHNFKFSVDSMEGRGSIFYIVYK